MKLTSELTLARRSAYFLAVALILTFLANTHLAPIENLKPVLFSFLIDLVCVVLFFSTFIVSWNAYGLHRESRSVVLALGFLCVAIFNFFHLTSGIFTVNNLNYEQITLLFSFLWRTTAAIILLFVAIEKVSSELSRRHSRWLLELALCLVAATSFLVFVYFDRIPSINHPGNWSNLIKKIDEILIIAMLSTASLIFYQQAKSAQRSDERKEKSFLFLACFTLALSELCFYFTHSPVDLLNVAGEIYKIISGLCLYLSIITISLKIPFGQLDIARQEILKNRSRLDRIIQTATDGIITIDSDHNVILVNTAAEAYFGYQHNEMLGINLNLLIPLRHQGGHAKHVDHFGKTGVSIRQMGVQSADFSVTGLKKDGQEFPIEASISSMLEDNQRFYTVIFRDITDRKIAKQKMEEYHRELSNLSQSLQTVREEERKHIARELHDDLGQLLAALRMDLTLLEKKTIDQTAAKPIFDSMDKLLLNSIGTLRRIASDLRPRALDEGGLYFALLTLQKEFKQRHLIQCDLTAQETELVLNDEVSTTVFRVIQESLTNVVRHAKATQVNIQLALADQKLNFSIQDNGKGISKDDFLKRQSFGLVGMRERVRALQGELTISGDEHGTRIEVTLPIGADLPNTN